MQAILQIQFIILIKLMTFCTNFSYNLFDFGHYISTMFRAELIKKDMYIGV